MIKQAFILAAGLGTRARPITNSIPKPMIEVKGQSLITRSLDQLISYGIEKVFINAFYKADMLKQHIEAYIRNTSTSAKIMVIEEPELLETGGGIINALPHLNNEPFFVVNSDAIWAGHNPFSQLNQSWQNSMTCLFLLGEKHNIIGHEGKGDFDLDTNNQLVRPKTFTSLPYIYIGTHITKPEIFAGLTTQKLKLMEVYSKLQDGDVYQNVYGTVYNSLWLHISTPKSVEEAEEALTKFTIAGTPSLRGSAQQTRGNPY